MSWNKLIRSYIFIHKCRKEFKLRTASERICSVIYRIYSPAVYMDLNCKNNIKLLKDRIACHNVGGLQPQGAGVTAWQYRHSFAAFHRHRKPRLLWNYRVRLEKHFKKMWSGSRRNQLETQWNFLSPLILTFSPICTGFEACTNQQSDYRPHKRQGKNQETPVFRRDGNVKNIPSGLEVAKNKEETHWRIEASFL